MRYLISVLIINSLNAFAQESGALRWEVDVIKAVDISIREKKPLFLFYTGSDWCAACKKLQNEVFSQPQFREWAKNNVILVELDFPRNKEPDPLLQPQNNQMKEIFGVSSYPTIIFASATRRHNGVYYTKLGAMGYMAGGPEVWLNSANQFLPARQ